MLDTIVHELIHVLQGDRFNRTGDRMSLDPKEVVAKYRRKDYNPGHGPFFHGKCEELMSKHPELTALKTYCSFSDTGAVTKEPGSVVLLSYEGSSSVVVFHRPTILTPVEREIFAKDIKALNLRRVTDMLFLETNYPGMPGFHRISANATFPRSRRIYASKRNDDNIRAMQEDSSTKLVDSVDLTEIAAAPDRTKLLVLSLVRKEGSGKIAMILKTDGDLDGGQIGRVLVNAKIPNYAYSGVHVFEIDSSRARNIRKLNKDGSFPRALLGKKMSFYGADAPAIYMRDDSSSLLLEDGIDTSRGISAEQVAQWNRSLSKQDDPKVNPFESVAKIAKEEAVIERTGSGQYQFGF
jgi:hypothetical protein